MVQVFDAAGVGDVERLYQQYLSQPDSVGPEWRQYFLGFEAGNVAAELVSARAESAAPMAGGGALTGGGEALALWQYRHAWRTLGHTVAHLNPLAGAPKVSEQLKPETYGLTAAALSEADQRLAQVWGGKVGIETSQLRNPAWCAWVQAWWENPANHAPTGRPTQLALYRGLVEANAFEQFLHKKFVGVKRFSLEGNDVVVPLLRLLAEAFGAVGGQHMVLGMAHRGRLNVLCNVLHKPLTELLAAFGDTLTTEGGPTGGDVKYHLGKTYVQHLPDGNELELQLLFNPSHLEAVNPMVLGAARAKAEALGNDGAKRVLPILIHGDSAVSGQGVVAECNNLMTLPAYAVGGTLHVVLNNQVGFTANPEDATSGTYCTDIFHAMGVPIVHVNADDPEACWRALRCAWEFRQQFGVDAVVDVVGYRRWGHNEGDDPTFTQPDLYAQIKRHPVPDAVYRPVLEQAGVPRAELDALVQGFQATLDAALKTAQAGVTVQGAKAAASPRAPDTKVDNAAMLAVAKAWRAAPKGFTGHDKVLKLVQERAEMLEGAHPLNWGAAETAAYGTLLQEGVPVRLTGQDVRRGTFSHRHAVLNGTGGITWSPLVALAKAPATLTIENSALSENAVMGFEYGVALARPQGLTIWEAQFGDFANGAQVVIDQFMASAEAKWGQMNGLTLLLPHGYEGQGPEHSSARVERFLQLCAQDNLRVAMPSTPAQVFHLLRQQAKHPQKRPLVIFTPKSLLRLPAAVSPVSQLLQGAWQPVLADEAGATQSVRKVVLCAGKVYYDLAARRAADKRDDVALVRLEQFYPWPEQELARVLGAFKTKNYVWVQEEPRNMGAWQHVRDFWQNEWGYVSYIGRPASATPAAGTTSQHAREQAAILDQVFGDAPASKQQESA